MLTWFTRRMGPALALLHAVILYWYSLKSHRKSSFFKRHLCISTIHLCVWHLGARQGIFSTSNHLHKGFWLQISSEESTCTQLRLWVHRICGSSARNSVCVNPALCIWSAAVFQTDFSVDSGDCVNIVWTKWLSGAAVLLQPPAKWDLASDLSCVTAGLHKQ